MLSTSNGNFVLSDIGEIEARRLLAKYPPKWYWYDDYYKEAVKSKAHAFLCERSYGQNLCQHGCADLRQVEKIIEVLQLAETNYVLDLGCGNGMISEYISDRTGANITGVDYIPAAIRQALSRTQAKRTRLSFKTEDLNSLKVRSHSFDAVIAIDTVYFARDLNNLVGQMAELLCPGGQMAIFYGEALLKPEIPLEHLLPDKTALGEALKKNGLDFIAYEFTQEDYEHAKLMKQIAEELKPLYEKEDNLFLFENRYIEASQTVQNHEAGRTRRYLYHIRLGC